MTHETHSVCNKHNAGGESVCCDCSGKKDCSKYRTSFGQKVLSKLDPSKTPEVNMNTHKSIEEGQNYLEIFAHAEHTYTFRACSICGSAVMDDEWSLRKHTEWHSTLKSKQDYYKHDHRHCPDTNSPCGIEGKHRCCLCGEELENEETGPDAFERQGL